MRCDFFTVFLCQRCREIWREILVAISRVLRFPGFGCPNLGAKKNNKQKTHKHFSDAPCGTIVPATNPPPVPRTKGQTGQNGDFTVELNRERPILSRGGAPFVPGTVPVCPGHRPAENVYVYWFSSCPRMGKFHQNFAAKNSAKTGKFHANFTLLGCGADFRL